MVKTLNVKEYWEDLIWFRMPQYNEKNRIDQKGFGYDKYNG